jgi:hypothetical protein
MFSVLNIDLAIEYEALFFYADVMNLIKAVIA